MIRRPPRSTQSRSSAASDVYKRQPASVHSEVTQAPLAGARVDPRRALAEEGAAGAHLVQDLVQPELVPHRDAGERLTCESRDLHVEDDLLEVEDHGATQQTRADQDVRVGERHQQAAVGLLPGRLDVGLVVLRAEAVSYTHLTLPTIYSV